MSAITITVEQGKQAADSLAAANPQLAADIQRTWQTDPKTRAEFGDDFNVYRAYRQAEAAGHVRILGERRS